MTGKDILIVEDENIVALDMRIRLESLGYRVVGVADSADTALSAMASSDPDLVLMDIKLRGGDDGIELAGKARETMDLPIVFVTAFTDERTLERAKLASPYGYIVKPFHERELRICIELALYKHEYEKGIRKARELAEEASRLKGEFLANMSHELKTPLNSVIGFTELALDRTEDEEQRDYLNHALRGATSLVKLIDPILEFARLESGRAEPAAAGFSPRAVLEGAAELLSVGAHGKGLAARFRIEPGLPPALVGDGERFGQVLANLVDNAVKFTPRGGILLAARPSAGPESEALAGAFAVVEAPAGRDRERPWIGVTLADSGPGIPPERVAVAFERFRQLDGSRSRPAGGTGLGLAIVKRSVELLGGCLYLLPVEGGGTRFEILLPFDPPETAVPAPKPLLGLRCRLVGFPDAQASDARSVLVDAGAASVAESPDLASALPARLEDEWLLVDESLLEPLRETAGAALPRSRLVLALRYGDRKRSQGRPSGTRCVGLPLLAGELARALRGAGPAPARGIAEETPSPPAGTEPRRAGPAGEASAGVLERVEARIARSLGDGDFPAVEIEAKAAEQLLGELGDEGARRLAFSVLLLARKADGPGLESISRTIRNRLAAKPVGADQGVEP